MASLSTLPKLGNTGVSSLIKSSQTLQNELTSYNDQLAALQYANSAYTDEAFTQYQSYLQNRINNLNSTGSITDASKALTLVKTLEGATHSNVSASITRENIQILSGNANLQDKYGVIVNQYQRAIGIGDLTLAQTLEKQAYDVSQQIQYQAQQAADASAALARAGNGRTTGTSGVTYQGEVVSNLQEGLKYLNSLAKNGSERELNANLSAFAKQQAPVLKALGVNIGTNQPNYFDVVYGVAGAIYNASVLKAQAEAPLNPLVSQTYATQAAQMLNGGTKFHTLAGDLTVQEIQQAQQDPNMFTYNNTTGKYIRDIQSGYQYMNFTDASGNQTTQLVPQYSNYADTGAGHKAYNQVTFLTPQETTVMTKLGLNFTENKTGTTGNGVQVAVTQNTPQWLKNVLGDKGIANFFTDDKGFTVFKAGSSNDQGGSYYTLANDSKGLAGLYEHLPNGSTQLVGGDYGFQASAVQLLINQGQQTQYKVQLAQQEAQQKLQLAQAQAQQALAVQQAQARASVQASAINQAQQVQRTASPQPPTFNPQRTASPQPPTFNPQGNTFNPQGGGRINPGSVAGTFRL